MRKISQRPSPIPSASRTLPHHCNPLYPHPSIHQLPPIRLPKIHPQPPRTPTTKKLLRIHKPPRKLAPYLLPDRIATSPNTRSHRRHQILNSRPILRHHHPNPPLHNPRHRPPPPCMKRPHHPLLHIHHQYRNAIRGPHPHQHPRHIRHQPIPLQHRLPLSSLQPPVQRPIPLPHRQHNPRVNLPHSHQHTTIIFTTNCTQKPSPILRHRTRIVLLRPPQIQRLAPIDRRNPTRARAEPMPQPPILLPPCYSNTLQPIRSFILNTQPATSNLPALQPNLSPITS
jgi:hypothetical protein